MSSESFSAFDFNASRPNFEASEIRDRAVHGFNDNVAMRKLIKVVIKQITIALNSNIDLVQADHALRGMRESEKEELASKGNKKSMLGDTTHLRTYLQWSSFYRSLFHESPSIEGHAIQQFLLAGIWAMSL